MYVALPAVYAALPAAARGAARARPFRVWRGASAAPSLPGRLAAGHCSKIGSSRYMENFFCVLQRRGILLRCDLDKIADNRDRREQR